MVGIMSDTILTSLSKGVLHAKPICKMAIYAFIHSRYLSCDQCRVDAIWLQFLPVRFCAYESRSVYPLDALHYFDCRSCAALWLHYVFFRKSHVLQFLQWQGIKAEECFINKNCIIKIVAHQIKIDGPLLYFIDVIPPNFFLPYRLRYSLPQVLRREASISKGPAEALLF